MTRPRRAPPLDRDARRATIIEAVWPLLAARGANVTTRELAEAAGVAEGTLFSVFDDKPAILLAAIKERLDPAPLERKLASLAELPDLEAKLVGVSQVVLPRLDEVHSLAVALHAMNVRGRPVAMHAPAYMRDWFGSIARSVRELVAPHAAELRVKPSRLAQIYTTLLFASRMPHVAPKDRLGPEELVSICLRGALAATRER